MSTISWVATALVALLTAGAFFGAAQSASALRQRAVASAPGDQAGPRSSPVTTAPPPSPPSRPPPASLGKAPSAAAPRGASAAADSATGDETSAPKRRTLSGPTGLVNLRASDVADVWVDGKRVGRTPLVDYELTAGAHKVRFDCHQDKGPPAKGVVRALQIEAGAMQNVEHECPEPDAAGEPAPEGEPDPEAPGTTEPSADSNDAVPIE